MAEAIKRGWASRRAKTKGVTKKFAKKPMPKRNMTAEYMRDNPPPSPIADRTGPRRQTGLPEHALIQALHDAGYGDAARFVQGWIARS